MGFDPKFRNCGLIKIETGGQYVFIYWSDNNSCRESVWIQGGRAVSAHWAGDYLIVTMSDGKVRKYETSSYYTVL